VQDLLRKDSDGLGTISVIRLNDIQDKPKLFSTFVLSLLAEIYETFPEIGDQDRPKLVLFIDEAHLFFKEASQALRDQIESIIKLIRSKGVGIFFCTQNPDDIPEEVLGQLGLKIQHALRAFTAKDRKAIKRASENFPLSNFYKTDELLTQLGIGEALVTALNEKGIPTPLVATLMRPPKSRMGILSDLELNGVMSMSSIKPKYDQAIDRESAFEILSEKLNRAKETRPQTIQRTEGKSTSETNTGIEILEELSKNTMVRQMGRTIGRELVRGLFGVLGMKKR
jgi:DNA helicase HerA-like ATPase